MVRDEDQETPLPENIPSTPQGQVSECVCVYHVCACLCVRACVCVVCISCVRVCVRARVCVCRMCVCVCDSGGSNAEYCLSNLRWETDDSYCSKNIISKPESEYYHGLLEFTDSCIFDFLMGQQATHTHTHTHTHTNTYAPHMDTHMHTHTHIHTHTHMPHTHPHMHAHTRTHTHTHTLPYL